MEDITAKVLGTDTSVEQKGPLPGMASDPATGGKQGTQTVANAALAGAAPASDPPVPNTTNGTTTVTEIPLVDRISRTEANEKSDADRLTAVENKVNELVDAFAAIKSNASSVPATDFASRIEGLEMKIFGSIVA